MGPWVAQRHKLNILYKATVTITDKAKTNKRYSRERARNVFIDTLPAVEGTSAEDFGSSDVPWLEQRSEDLSEA